LPLGVELNGVVVICSWWKLTLTSRQNGGYINPPAIKRQHRDPHADWWDPQERRNFGETVHEDNDILGIFSPWDYTWTTTGPGLIMIGTFIATVLGVSGLVYLNYPDRIAYPREFENGLERELGGPGAVRVRNWEKRRMSLWSLSN
jgi:NADH dehydrogenase (ubiquinone) 1 beta subcomplex subunit 8